MSPSCINVGVQCDSVLVHEEGLCTGDRNLLCCLSKGFLNGAAAKLFRVVTYIGNRDFGLRYSGTPLIRINSGGEPCGYAENLDNWIFI